MSAPDGPPHVLLERLELHPTAFVAPGATVVGRVTMGAESSVWFGAVMRGCGCCCDGIEPVRPS